MTPEAAARRWSLTDLAPLATTPRADLWTARMPGHGTVVLKLLTPEGADEIVGARLLLWLDGAGAARLIAMHGSAMVIEHLPGPPLSDLVRQGQDLAAARELARVACAIATRPGHRPSALEPLDRHLRRLRDATAPWPDALRPSVARARELFRVLMATAPAQRPLHGDLHHDNILAAPRGWLAIDPKGLLGDPAFDLANSFRNPFDRQDLARDPARARRVAAVHESVTGLPAARLLGWAAVLAVTSAGWNLDAGEPIAHDVALIEPFLSLAGAVRPSAR
jgi:streptomycin 6-kinase